MPKNEQPQNTRAEPMTYEYTQMPRGILTQRAQAAQEVEGMGMEELRETAARLQIDTAGLTSKAALSQAIQDSVRPTNAE